MAARIWADELMIYAKDDPDFAVLAKRFEGEAPEKNKAEVAYSARDFSLILDRYTNLKQVLFYTHGNVGYLHLAGGGIHKSSVSLLKAPHTKLFFDTGRALFIGCNIGEGQDGRDFLVAAGQALFKGCGGIVGGATSKNLFGRWGLFDAFMPPWGDLRVIQLDAGGNVLKEKLF